MLTVTKRFEFCYGHCLPEHPGKCKNIHGHNCTLEVTVTRRDGRERVPETGMVVDFGDIKKIVDPFIQQLDHQFINEVLPEKYLPPTAESLALWFHQQLHLAFQFPLTVVRVRVYETKDSYAESTVIL